MKFQVRIEKVPGCSWWVTIIENLSTNAVYAKFLAPSEDGAKQNAEELFRVLNSIFVLAPAKDGLDLSGWPEAYRP